MLFDLDRDPLEQTNIARREAERTERMHAQLLAFIAECASAEQTLEDTSGFSEEELEVLGALGYLR